MIIQEKQQSRSFRERKWNRQVELTQTAWYTKKGWGERVGESKRSGVFNDDGMGAGVVEDSLFFAAAGVESCRTAGVELPSQLLCRALKSKGIYKDALYPPGLEYLWIQSTYPRVLCIFFAITEYYLESFLLNLTEVEICSR
jgi:hypothetical protein